MGDKICPSVERQKDHLHHLDEKPFLGALQKSRQSFWEQKTIRET